MCSLNLSVILKSFEKNIKVLLNWYKVNLLKENTNKFQFMILGDKDSKECKFKINNTYKLFALQRIRNLLTVKQVKTLASSFIH